MVAVLVAVVLAVAVADLGRFKFIFAVAVAVAVAVLTQHRDPGYESKEPSEYIIGQIHIFEILPNLLKFSENIKSRLLFRLYFAKR